jgi:hypothetical protein
MKKTVILHYQPHNNAAGGFSRRWVNTPMSQEQAEALALSLSLMAIPVSILEEMPKSKAKAVAA